MIRLFITAAATFLCLAGCDSASAKSGFYGIGRSIDGDSLMVGEREVRLFGIDAPEFNQSCTRNGQQWRCGEDAAEQLSKLATGKNVSCVAVDTDEHRRTVARCSVAAIDLNRQMVATGYAIAYRRYSMDFVSAEASAKAAKRGIWSGSFQMPSDVRQAADQEVARSNRGSRSRSNVSNIRSSGPSNGCVIKGNRGSNGWIYHVPGMPYYDRTRAEEMFCTEAQARAAGYRRARVR